MDRSSKKEIEISPRNHRMKRIDRIANIDNSELKNGTLYDVTNLQVVKFIMVKSSENLHH